MTRVLPRTAFCLALLLIAGCSKEPRPKPRHLLLISVDTLRVDRLGCYGGRPQTSPAIDRLAERGVLFESAFATSSSTLPAVTTLMTGKYPSEHGVIANRFFPLPEKEDLLAERLGESGFTTAAFVANQLLAAGSRIGQGFERHEAYQALDASDGKWAETKMTADASRWLRQNFTPDGRAFLWVHYMQPHAPYTPPPELAGRFLDPGYRGDVDGDRGTLNQIYIDKRQLTDPELRRVLGLYDASVRYVDDQIGRLLAELKASDQLEDTLVVFVADHGEDLYDHHAYFYHANSVYRSSLQVPLIFSWPGRIPSGERVSSVVSGVDVRNTVLGLLGFPPDPRGDGRDLSPLWRREAKSARELAFAQFEGTLVTAFSDRWTFIDNPEELTPRNVPVEGVYPVARRELYDRSKDRDEQQDVASEQPDIVARLEESIARWRGTLRDPDERPSDLRSRSELEQLRRLGYAGRAATKKKKGKEEESDEEDR